MMIVGNDISEYQGNPIDWQKMASKSQFIWIRGAIRKDPDNYYQENLAGAKSVNIPAGLFFVPIPINLRSWQEQAAVHADIYNANPTQLPPAIDMERDGGLDKNDMGNWLEKYIKRFCELTGIERYEDVMSYTRAGWFDYEMPLTNSFWRTMLWVADYTPPVSVPKEWSNHKKTWTIHQTGIYKPATDYGCRPAPYAAVGIDQDIFDGDETQFENTFGVKPGQLTTPPPPQQDVINPIYQALVKYSSLNVRAGPGTQFSDIGTLPGGADIPVVSESGDWSEVRGYVYKPGIAKK